MKTTVEVINDFLEGQDINHMTTDELLTVIRDMAGVIADYWNNEEQR